MAASPKYRPRFKDKRHLKFVASQPCCVYGCENQNVQAHHPLSTKARQKLGKSHDYECVPLCQHHHAILHDRIGGELLFMIKYNVTFEKVWTRLCEISPSKKVREINEAALG